MRSKPAKIIVVLAIIGAIVAARQFLGIDLLGTEPVAEETAIIEAFRAGESNVWVESTGQVAKLLRDDDDGSRHQRFIVRLAGGHTVLIAHNIDLAARVPLDEGDSIDFRGEYEWSDKGGVVHWTHHDPQGRREGGWIRHGGEVYE